MKIIQTLIICNIAFISACGGSDSPAGNVNTPADNVTAPTIDGPKQVLFSDEDGFISTESDNLKFEGIEAPITQTFTAATQQQLTITSQSGDACHINIYTRYNKSAGTQFAPLAGSRVVQMHSEDCTYSGTIALLNQQRKLLIEVINLSLEDTTSYYEETIQSNAIEVAIK